MCSKKLFNLVLLTLFLVPVSIFAQEKDNINATSQIVTENISKSCKELDLGKNTQLQSPFYPTEAKTARIGGSVQIKVLINEDGKVEKILDSKGNKLLIPSAQESALKAEFTPTICDGVVIKTNGIITYNFIPIVFTENYFIPQSIEDFSDVSEGSNYYESILYLTENYKLTFGYADKKFHMNAPLTKGDFIHFLRLTLDFLQKRAEMSNKIPLEIGLYSQYNPQKIKSPREIKDLEKSQPYSESTEFLVSKYNISLINDEKELRGKLPLTQNEVINFWRKIFGKEAVPVNFKQIKTGDRIFTRGEFALFLQESLYVLTYKVLP